MHFFFFFGLFHLDPSEEEKLTYRDCNYYIKGIYLYNGIYYFVGKRMHIIYLIILGITNKLDLQGLRITIRF